MELRTSGGQPGGLCWAVDRIHGIGISVAQLTSECSGVRMFDSSSRRQGVCGGWPTGGQKGEGGHTLCKSLGAGLRRIEGPRKL